MSEAIPAKAVERLRPEGEPLPVVYDSPHSGTFHPDDFRHAVDPFLLRGAEDRFVDDLILDAPAHGIALVRALFARAYVDPNREETDLDPELVDAEEWGGAISPGVHSRRGTGLIFRLVGDRVPVYDRSLPRSEVEHRVERYWRAYHDCLQAEIDAAHAVHGVVWHLNWHSMQSVGNALSPDPGMKRPHFVLGDRHGTSCSPEFTAFVASGLREEGYDVAVNRPYAGAYIVRRHGDPQAGKHSLQVEINRGLYMDQRTLEATEGLPRLRAALGRFTARLAKWVDARRMA